MHRVSLITAFITSLSLLVPCQPVSASSWSDRVSEIIQERLTMSPRQPAILCRKELLCGLNVLLQFYATRGFQPAWSSETDLLPQATVLVSEINGAAQEGLSPNDYHRAAIENMLADLSLRAATDRLPEPEMQADMDILLTDAFLLYGSHLLIGRVNPETVQPEWVIESRDADLAEILQTALDTNNIAEALENLRPQHPGYGGLIKALSAYENILSIGGWPDVPPGPKMEKGDRGPRVSALRSHLIASGDLDLSDQNDHDLFDEVLEEAVRRFQVRHGLEVDGVVGRETLKALNVSVEERLRQLKANLDRWRWLPQDLGWRYILVNIANFELDIVERGEMVMTMRVVVGRRYRSTPVFTGTMTYLELNPYWHVPPNIARRDILPHAKGDPQYLFRKKIRIFQSWDDNAPEIRPESIDWSKITPGSLLFKFRQEPGPDNALGRAKFMFPNKFNVYLHDTPARELFKKTKRTFSSGCIRIERPIDLAAFVLRGDPEWTQEKILAVIDAGETRIVQIPEPIPVHLLYWTAWVDSDGTIHFRDDIYERDERLDQALNERPPSP